MATDLLLMVEGEPVSLDNVIWEAVGPCGCPFAWHVATVPDAVLSSTPEQAKAHLFGESAVERKYHEDSGAIIRPILRGNIPRNTCEHAPRFGLPDADAPEGHEWATTDGHFGRQSHKRHIVPTLPEGDTREAFTARRDAVAICGKGTTRGAYYWRSDRTDKWAHVVGKVPCSKCIKAASGPVGDGRVHELVQVVAR